MAWPRSKKSRSSALPGTSEHDGVQVSVTPAPDADRAEGTKQNAGVNGTRYSVSDRPGSPTSRWTAGGRRSANGRQAASPPKAAGVQYADSGVDDVSAEIDEATDVSGGRRRDDGIAILEGVVTTEVPPDDETAAHGRPGRAAAGVEPALEPAASAGRRDGQRRGGRADLVRRSAGVRHPARVGQRPAADQRARPAARRAAALLAAARDRHGGRRRGVRDPHQDWEVALTLAILAGIVDTVHRSRNAAAYVSGGGSPAARSAAPGGS